MKKIVAISFAVCLSLSAVVNAQPTGSQDKPSLSQMISKKTKNQYDLPKQKENENPYKAGCDNGFSLMACREYAAEVWQSKNINQQQKRNIVATYLKKACNLTYENSVKSHYDSQSCGILGIEYADPKLAKERMGLFSQSNFETSLAYFQAACFSSKSPEQQKQWCGNLKIMVQEKVRRQGYVSSEDIEILQLPY